MNNLLLILGICILILFLIFLFLWRNTDWRHIDEENQKYIDSDGNHAYYDRKIINHNKNDKR